MFGVDQIKELLSIGLKFNSFSNAKLLLEASAIYYLANNLQLNNSLLTHRFCLEIFSFILLNIVCHSPSIFTLNLIDLKKKQQNYSQRRSKFNDKNPVKVDKSPGFYLIRIEFSHNFQNY